MSLVTPPVPHPSFSNLPFYTRVNARLLDLAEVGKQRKIVDLGCGTGGVTKLILERLQSAKDTVIYAVDHSTSALKAAAEEIGDRKDVAINYVHSEVQNLMKNTPSRASPTFRSTPGSTLGYSTLQKWANSARLSISGAAPAA